MFHSIKDSLSVVAERMSFVLLGSVIVLVFFNEIQNPDSDTDGLTFIVGSHCEKEVKDYFYDLNSEFTASIRKVDYNNGEFPNVAGIAEIRHESLDVNELERYANGAMAKCWTNSFSRYELGDHEDMVRAVDYVNMLNRHGDSPILISVERNIMTIRTDK